MADLKPLARIVRWGTASTILNLQKLPADKLDWKPEPTCKSALDVVAEVTGVMRTSLPMFSGGSMEYQPEPPATTLEEACARLQEASNAYVAALEAAGDELEQPVETPMGTFWGSYAVVFGLIDLLHHHGQLTYLQSLLGDAEMHADMEAIQQCFGVPATES
ncbi:MAG: DinB family protein [Actinomycetota bacterium]